MKIKIFKKKKIKKYEWTMEFKNGKVLNGSCEFTSLDEVYSTFLKNTFTQLFNNTKGFYYNAEEILYFQAIEVKNEEKVCDNRENNEKA